MYEYRATVLDIVDGDTLKLRVDLGFSTFTERTLRLARINCPEMNVEEGKVAKTAVALAVFTGKDTPRVTVRTTKLKRSDREKVGRYGRYIVDVLYINNEGKEVNLNDELVNMGMAIYTNY